MILSLDVGTGSGTKIAAFDEEGGLLGQGLFKLDRYSDSLEGYSENLISYLKDLLNLKGINLTALGISAPGIFDNKGRTMVMNNIPIFNGEYLPSRFSELFNCQAVIGNDADLGAIAIYKNFYQQELFYWVYGGGWGGAWLADDGCIVDPIQSLIESEMNWALEPGHCIPIYLLELKDIIHKYSCDLELLKEIILMNSVHLNHERKEGVFPEKLRSEELVSGKGFWRLALMVCEKIKNSNDEVDQEIWSELTNFSTANKTYSKIKKFHSRKYELIEILYQEFWLLATSKLMTRLKEHTSHLKEIPIWIGGGASVPLINNMEELEKRLKNKVGKIKLYNCQSLNVSTSLNLLGAYELAKEINRV